MPAFELLTTSELRPILRWNAAAARYADHAQLSVHASWSSRYASWQCLRMGRAAGKVEGTFILSKTDARLQHVRATTVKLDAKGTLGYAILMSAKPADGDITSWQTGHPLGAW